MLLDGGVLTVDKNGIPSNADSSSRLSKEIAKGIADQLMAEVHEKALGQTSGAKFELPPVFCYRFPVLYLHFPM